ncbi:MAG: hypothetical protein FWF81_10885 [Defluviitaleaceae bacterium]|nr:hypothetical protein [Defluviitaleaceae bacterium]
MKKFLKILTMAVLISVVAAAVGVIFSLITSDGLFANLFRFAFAAGTFVIAAAIILLILPIRVRNPKLFDHESFMDAREKKRSEAYNLLWIGIFSVLFTGVVELIVFIANTHLKIILLTTPNSIM